VPEGEKYHDPGNEFNTEICEDYGEQLVAHLNAELLCYKQNINVQS
jgi:hypothetical protein